MRVDHEVVRKAPLFAALDSEDADALLAQMSPVRMERGDILFREGERGDSLYVIGEGKIKLGRSSSDGRENLVAILGPGEMFGELSLFDPGPADHDRDGGRRDAAAGTRQRLPHGPADRTARGRQGRSSPRSRSDCAAPTSTSRTSSSPTCRAAWPRRCSISPSGSAARSRTASWSSHDLTQEELAQLVGASRETVNKALADFAGRGWLKLEARAVLLLDVDRLRRRAR